MKGIKTGGRQRGTPNKMTAVAKDAVSLAFEGLGGVPALIAWAKDNRTEFYRLWIRLLPLQVTGGSGEPIKLVVVTGVPQSDESTS
jgi:hypothetical protein